jgi:hypothetical protein
MDTDGFSVYSSQAHLPLLFSMGIDGALCLGLLAQRF